MYIIEPLYQGDISIDSTFEDGEITHLVYELDEVWNGDELIAGTNVFAVGGELADLFKSDMFKGFTLRNMEVLYEGTMTLPGFIQLVPDEILNVVHGEYNEHIDKDIYLTKNVGELVVSDILFENIKKHMNKSSFKSHEIFYNEGNKKDSEKFNYEYIIITACSTPFDLLPSEIKKNSTFRNGTFIVKEGDKNVYISAPYLECLKKFDIDIHGYMNCYEPYFLTVKGNDKQSVLSIIKCMCSRNFYIAESFDEHFVPCLEFISQN